LLVAVDGRQSGYSVGMTTFEMAQTMVRLGATRAMALDGGGSTTIAFNGSVLNRPSDGRERPISTALMLFYSGVYAPPPAVVVHSPNGDGVDEAQELGFKIVRPSTVTVTLTAPGGRVAFRETGTRAPGTYRVPFPPPTAQPEPPPTTPPTTPPVPADPVPPAEGRWKLTVSATDDQGLVSSASHRFWVNSTLGFLNVQPKMLVLPPAGRNATVSWAQTRAAQVTVTAETPGGIVVRTIASRTFQPGKASVLWDGRQSRGRLVFGGLYRIRVTAKNAVGAVSLEQELRVRRVAGKKPKKPGS
jgi:hypothetical protein